MLTGSVPISGEVATSATGGEMELARQLPCRTSGDPDLWFAESPNELERAKALCAECPVKTRCLEGALAREEPWGVWGGEIFDRGAVVTCKRPRGRPRKDGRMPGSVPESADRSTAKREVAA